jgi:periodic tryptophan protein 2
MLGKVHTAGNILFSKDGDSIYSIVTNRVTKYNLSGSTVQTTTHGHKQDIQWIAKPNSDKFMLMGTRVGMCSIVSLPNGVLVNTLRFNPIVAGASFSQDPSSSLFVTFGSSLIISKLDMDLKVLLSTRQQEVAFFNDAHFYTSVDWIDSKYLCVGTDGGAIHLFKITKEESTITVSNPFVITGLKGRVLGVWFGYNQKGEKSPNIAYAIDEHGNLLHWEKEWEMVKVETLGGHQSDCTSADISFKQGFIAVASHGAFTLYSLEDTKTHIKKVELTPGSIQTIIFNPSGDWVALGSANLGQLIVYDVKSETFMMKQQGHNAHATCISYSGQGEYIASGDEEGKIKVWDTKNGTCFITLEGHSATVTGLKFSRPPGSRDAALFTSSLDGTCHAFDLLRYKKFRSYSAPTPTAFSCMEIDPSGEIICAAGQDEFDIYLWNVQTTNLLDTLKSHSAPISEMAFSSTQPIMVSASWDKTVKIWDIFGSKGSAESLDHSSEVVSVAFNPANGTEIVASTLDGNLTFWNVVEGQQVGYIEGRRDIVSAPYVGEDSSSVQVQARKYFGKVKYTSDGAHVVCGGLNQFICLYSVEQRVLLKRFVISNNSSLNGVLNLGLLWEDTGIKKVRLEKDNSRNRRKMIGEQRIPGSKLEIIPEIKCYDISFTASEFAVSTTEGIVVFSNEIHSNFNPFDLDMDVYPENVQKELLKKNYTMAMIMAVKLNDDEILRKTTNQIPSDAIEIVVRGFPDKYLANLLAFLSSEIEKNTNLEKILTWCKSLLLYQGKTLKNKSGKFQTHLRAILRNIKRSSILDVVRENEYTLEYLSSFKNGLKRKFESVATDVVEDELTGLKE